MNKFWTRLTYTAAAVAVLSLGACAAPEEPVDIDSMSLEKTSPFETATPQSFQMGAKQYRETQYGAPAVIPHGIEAFKITPDSNPCMFCHGDAKKIGAAKQAGQATAMPQTHWTKVKGKLVMQPSRYECGLCHAPQADVKPLVDTVH